MYNTRHWKAISTIYTIISEYLWQPNPLTIQLEYDTQCGFAVCIRCFYQDQRKKTKTVKTI